jgi:hypothetical protein
MSVKSFSTFHFSFFIFHFSFSTFHFSFSIFHFSLFTFHFSLTLGVPLRFATGRHIPGFASLGASHASPLHAPHAKTCSPMAGLYRSGNLFGISHSVFQKLYLGTAENF